MEYIEKVHISFGQQQFMTFLGAQLLKTKQGYCEIELPYKEELTQQHMYFHAGAVSTIADTAAGYAGYSVMDVNDEVLTVEFKVNLLAPAKGEKLVARAQVIKPGRTLVICRSDVFTVNAGVENLCATALVTLIALKDYKNK